MISAKSESWVTVENTGDADDFVGRLLRSIWNTLLDGFAIHGACMDRHASAADLQLYPAVRSDEHAETRTQTVGAQVPS